MSSQTITDCYECEHFVAGGRYTCQARPRPEFSLVPTNELGKFYFVPAPVTWRTPDGVDTHCNSFAQKFKETLF